MFVARYSTAADVCGLFPILAGRATPSFKVDIGPSWELMDALISPCSLRKVLPLPPWLYPLKTTIRAHAIERLITLRV